VPNALSALRILLVPVFLVLVLLELDLVALIVIVVSSVSDFLDGIIARRFGQITRLGQLLDPAADRLFIFAAVIALAVREVVPWWIVAVIVGRDALLAGLGLVLARHGYGPLPVHHLGKVATFALFYALPLLVLGQAFPALQPVSDPLGWAFTIWGAFLYWWAGILYVRQTREVTSRSRASGSDASHTLGVQRRSMDD
jgi:cardiolipin synthase